MDIKIGTVVKSRAGRDKNTFLVVVSVDSRFAVVSDGKARPLEVPKKKNLRHLMATNKSIPVSDVTSNGELRNLFKALKL